MAAVAAEPMPDIVPKALTLRHVAQAKAGADAAVVWRHVEGKPELVFMGRWGTPPDPRTLNTDSQRRCQRTGVHRRTVHGATDLVGTPTTLWLKALAGAYPRTEAPVVERMRAAGAIPIGRTNCPNFTVRWHTDSELWGATVNPWDRSRTPGASSGGEAAALATGMTPLGLGSDGLGSLRWPAQCCGISCLSPPLAASRMRAL